MKTCAWKNDLYCVNACKTFTQLTVLTESHLHSVWFWASNLFRNFSFTSTRWKRQARSESPALTFGILLLELFGLFSRVVLSENERSSLYILDVLFKTFSCLFQLFSVSFSSFQHFSTFSLLFSVFFVNLSKTPLSHFCSFLHCLGLVSAFSCVLSYIPTFCLPTFGLWQLFT